MRCTVRHPGAATFYKGRVMPLRRASATRPTSARRLLYSVEAHQLHVSATEENSMRCKNIPLWMVGIGALALACDRPIADPNAETRRDAETETLARAERPAEQPDADDTGINTRDRAAGAVTPMDQSNEARDLEVTREIREAITADDSLSTDAQNVKVVTQAGVVVLRGPVESDQEKAAIVAIATRTAGVSRVDDQLEVARD